LCLLTFHTCSLLVISSSLHLCSLVNALAFHMIRLAVPAVFNPAVLCVCCCLLLGLASPQHSLEEGITPFARLAAGQRTVHETVVAAGSACLAAVAAAGDRSSEEVFYACPTLSVPEFFRAAAATGGGAGRQPGLAGADFDAASQLARAVQVRLFRRLL
jgi:hypothetical protein